jgi:hypothetical protein
MELETLAQIKEIRDLLRQLVEQKSNATRDLPGVKITKLASGYDQIEIHTYDADINEAGRQATEVWNDLYGSGTFLMPIPKEGTEKSR